MPSPYHKISTDSSSDHEKDDSSTEGLLPSSEDDMELAESRYRKIPVSHLSRWLTAINLILFCFSLAVLANQVYGKIRITHSKNWLLKQTSFYSPVFDTIDLATPIIQTDGSLFDSPNPSPYRNGRAPDPAVNTAWEEFDSIRTFPVTAEDVKKLGKDPSNTVKYPESYGLGSEAYVAQLDIFHQIHCLNLLRHLAWSTYDHNATIHKKPYSDLHWIHVSHCTDILMQNLMCTGNLDVLTFNWMETQDLPFPDFFVNHQCRDFDAIAKWQDDHALPLEMGRNLTKPSDAVEIPIPDPYWEIFGVERVQVHD